MQLTKEIEDFRHKFVNEKGEISPTDLRKKLFSLSAERVSVVSHSTSSADIIGFGLSLSFNKDIKTYEEVTEKIGTVVSICNSPKGRKDWLTALSHLATHQPKSSNDKVSNSGLHNTKLLSLASLGLITSSSIQNGASVSGAGNAALLSYYNFFSWTLRIDKLETNLFELFATNNSWLMEGLAKLGLDSGLLSQTVLSAQTRRSLVPNYIDRRQRQIFLPLYLKSEAYCLVTPVSSTRLISGFRHTLRSYRAEGKNLRVHTITVGGTKPGNAGALLNETGGKLQHLTMSFPKASLSDLQKMLHRLVKGRSIFDSLDKDNLVKFKKNFSATDGEGYADRQTQYILEKRYVANLVRPILFNLQNLVRELHDTPQNERDAFLAQLRSIPKFIRAFFLEDFGEISFFEMKDAFINDAFKGLQRGLTSGKNGIRWDDSYNSRLEKILSEVIGDLLE